MQALESGKTINPITTDLVNFSAYFNVSIDNLIKTNLLKVTDRELSRIIETSDDYVSGTHMRVLAISVDRTNKENVEYVPLKARAGYQAGFNDPEYIAALPKLSLPNLPSSGTFRMFPTTGKSMLPIPENSDILCEYVADWKSLKPDTPCIVILSGTQDFVFKLVTVLRDAQVMLKSLN